MVKVEYVLFKEALPLKAPRLDERDFISVAAGADLRYKAINWSILYDAAAQVIILQAGDEKEQTPPCVVPVSNCRLFRLSK